MDKLLQQGDMLAAAEMLTTKGTTALADITGISWTSYSSRETHGC